MVNTSSENVAWFVKNIGDTEVASLIEALAAERDAALSNSPAWRTMDSAPKEDCLVDLWCISPDEDAEPSIGVRLTDCYWTDRGWARTLDDGDEDFVQEEATCEFGLPAWKPIAWMPLPASPTEQTQGSLFDAL